MSLSKIVISGRVVRGPEKRFTPNNNLAVTEFTMSVTLQRGPDGTSETNNIRVVSWSNLAERVAQEIKKGDMVAVDGRLQINTHTSADGQRKRDAEIDAIAVENLSTLLNAPAPAATDEETDRPVAKAASGGQKQNWGGAKTDDLDAMFSSEDEIPF
jgi:single-strand DNA-binding protein